LKQFENKVAVITGGASGLGLAMARRFGAAGMKIMIADIESDNLSTAVDSLRESNIDANGVLCDVSNAEDVEQLAQETLNTYGAVHVVCNNAGVAPSGLIWEHSTKDWEWAMGPNVWGVIHGIRVFTPILLGQKEEGHIINTASVAGLMSFNGMGLYCMTKHSVVTMSECLHHDLESTCEHVRCSVLCPAYVPTQIAASERNRPNHLKDNRNKSKDELVREENLRKAVESGKISAEQVAEQVFDAVKDNRFYILTHPKIKPAIGMRYEDIQEERSPRDTSRRA
jgi:NAD(P)-dependent dehydrogenase (short-subunit alcohol dehydrogenase family)